MNANFKLNTFVLLTMALLLCPPAANALEPKMNTMTLAPELSYITYKDTAMKEKGPFYGVLGAYTYRGALGFEKLSKGMLKLEGRLVYGKVNFDGQLVDGNTYRIRNVDDFLGEVRALGGYDFPIFESTTITPFTGFGYRFLKDNLSKDNAGYRREANYFYSPIGAETNTPLAQGWSAGVSAEYDFFWFGRQDTFYSDLDPLFSDITNDQNKGYGLRGSLKVHKEMEDKNFIFEPYVNYWNIGSSDTVGLKHTGVVGHLITEPKNNSTEIGMRVAVEF